jgi:hypothetical protein
MSRWEQVPHVSESECWRSWAALVGVSTDVLADALDQDAIIAMCERVAASVGLEELIGKDGMMYFRIDDRAG